MDIYDVKEAQRSSILHWNFRDYRQFPEELKYFGQHVQDLYLKGNKITKLPKWLPTLENLSELYLSGNKLKELPDKISELKSLTVLDVSCNKITSLPDSIIQLNRLQKLCADKNEICSLPTDIGKLKCLYYLLMSKNKLKQIPESIGKCKSLQEINFDFNEITSLPYSMVRLPNLCYFSIRNNCLMYLPFIPFESRPCILCNNNAYLNYLSYSFSNYINEKHWPKDEPTNTTWNIYSERFSILPDNLLNSENVIKTEANLFLVLPPKLHFKYQEESGRNCEVSKLYELCLRTICGDEKYFTDKILKRLPRIIKEELKFGPLALCDNCHKMIFNRVILGLFLIEISGQRYIMVNKYIVACFCSSYCSKMFKLTCLNENCTFVFHQVEWTHVTRINL